MKKYKFITIERDGFYSGKPMYRVFNNKTKNHLAVISYYRPFKSYVFEASEGKVFGINCLKDIIDFMENEIK